MILNLSKFNELKNTHFSVGDNTNKKMIVKDNLRTNIVKGNKFGCKIFNKEKTMKNLD